MATVEWIVYGLHEIGRVTADTHDAAWEAALLHYGATQDVVRVQSVASAAVAAEESRGLSGGRVHFRHRRQTLP